MARGQGTQGEASGAALLKGELRGGREGEIKPIFHPPHVTYI